jgi:hypothetical protein
MNLHKIRLASAMLQTVTIGRPFAVRSLVSWAAMSRMTLEKSFESSLSRASAFASITNRLVSAAVAIAFSLYWNAAPKK